MRSIFLLALILISACSILHTGKTEDNSILFTVASDTVRADEFIYAFQKNRPEDSAVSKKELEEYLTLYKNFKLKVAEAKAKGMDTTGTFLNEYSTYMAQLDNSYLQSSNDLDSIVIEAYERMQYEVNASHILIMAEESAPPKDTLIAFNKISAIRDSIVRANKDFAEMAIQYSEDPSARQNKGELGYFGVFQMVYPFESAAFNTSPGEVSLPVRTKFGYHIINVNDKRPNDGKVRVAHIMIRNSSTAEDKVYNLFNQLQNGADWDQLCKANSEDYQSASRGGELAPFNRGQIVKEFSDAAFGLTTVGELTEPIKTPYGWHIIKLLEYIPVKDFNSMRQQLRAQVRRDTRSQVSEQKMLERLARENKLVELQPNIQQVLEPENHNFGKSKFDFETDTLKNLTLFSVGQVNYIADSLYRFIDGISKHQNSRQFLFKQYQAYQIIEYFKFRLNFYKFLKKEYYDGILLFSIMEDVIWNPASNDSIGINSYYEQHKTNYIDSTTIEIATFTSSAKSVIDSIARVFPTNTQFLSLDKSEKEAITDQNNASAKVSLQLEFGEQPVNNHPYLSKIGLPQEPIVVEIDGQWHYLLPIRQPGEPRRLE